MTNPAMQARIKFMEIDEKQRVVLRASKPLIEKNIGRALDRFYARARITPETSRLFSSEAHMKSAHAAQVKHWMTIVDAKFDEHYYQSVRRIGQVHARIGLEPQWYIGSYALIMEEIIDAVYRDRSPLKRLSGAPSQGKLTGALMKAAFLDMELSLSIYFEEAASERNNAISKLEDALARLAKGDLAQDIAGMPEAFSTLEQSYNQTLSNLRRTIGSVVVASDTIQDNSRSIAVASQDLARKMEGNAAALEETAAALVQIDERVKTTATGAKETLALADQALLAMEKGQVGATHATERMKSVQESAQGIDEVIEGVDKIAFQTRVLAMNAAIEAGRAGEAGRGFAVVADLVNKLAMRAEEEAQKARAGLTSTQTDIKTAVEAVNEVNDALEGVSSKYEQVYSLIGQMTNDNEAQSLALTEINEAVGSMDIATQQNAIMIDNTSHSAEALHEHAVKLANYAGRFQLEKAA